MWRRVFVRTAASNGSSWPCLFGSTDSFAQICGTAAKVCNLGDLPSQAAEFNVGLRDKVKNCHCESQSVLEGCVWLVRSSRLLLTA
jgi:hypothetical protein